MNTFLVAVLQPWLQALATAVVPLVPLLLARYLRQRHNRSVLAAAFERAAAVAYGHVVKNGGRITDPEAVARAVEAGTTYLLDLVPDTLRAEGVQVEDASKIVAAGLDKALVADPAITVGGYRP